MSISLDQGPPASSALNASSTLLDRMSAQGSKAAVAPAKIEVMDDALDDGSDLEDGEGMMGADDDEQLTTGRLHPWTLQIFKQHLYDQR